MRKLIAAINITLDGFCDHTSGIPDAELHQHYTDLLRSADTILYGRVTYQLMESYWPAIVQNPTGEKETDDFALSIDAITKVVFSHKLKALPWKNSRLATRDLKSEILQLKQQPGKDFFVGSPGLIAQATNLHLVDEFQLCIHPVVAGSGLRLFKDVPEMFQLKLLKTKPFASGAVIHYYAPTGAMHS